MRILEYSSTGTRSTEIDSTTGVNGSRSPRLMRPMVSTAMWATIETVIPMRMGWAYWSCCCVIRPILVKPDDDNNPITRMTEP